MGFLNNFIDEQATAKLRVKDSKEVFNDLLKVTSGSSIEYKSNFNILYQIVAFKGVVEGVGTSTLVANTALALASLGNNVLVIDTSIRHPVQDVLLKTRINMEEPLDWFDMPYTKASVLHTSTLSNKISVLSFKGKKKNTIIDSLGTKDNRNLVEIALSKLHNMFDIILIDCCDELSNINTACLQMSNKVIQVWNDTPSVMDNIDSFIDDCSTLSCRLDKMRNVVFSRICNETMGSMDSILAEYRCRKIAENYQCQDIYTALTQGKTLFQLPSNNTLVEAYTACVIQVACHLLGVDYERELRASEEKPKKDKKSAGGVK